MPPPEGWKAVHRNFKGVIISEMGSSGVLPGKPAMNKEGAVALADKWRESYGGTTDIFTAESLGEVPFVDDEPASGQE